ncbi:Tcp11-domain-containing protein [Hortaea werneckii]|nr:Tcp11-domain-containing protein [Hortaea werneckii]KAI7211101.1 Tcp11-domain-containing protein [Hortaea werneckii]KAI7305237.1 Tcp11-domain-containing protein [Hortaea werneckii]KAI7553226.1 Tcp11-domain-containing protein [Hortaea werneckii]
MHQPPGQQLDRRDSLPCSPTSTRGGHGNAPFNDEAYHDAARRAPGQSPSVAVGNGSQEQETAEWDNASHSQESAMSLTPSSMDSSTPPIWQSPNMTDQEIVYDIFSYILEMLEPNGADVSYCYERATMVPPITAESLAELDMHRIINNPKLRHDVNFDRDLHFRPNLDGSKGRQKVESAEQYWQALEGELFMLGFGAQMKMAAADTKVVTYWERVLKHSQRRLRSMFEAIRDILKTLVSDYEQKTIIERLDVDLMMQEISNGVCDLLSLSTWLTKVLKAHCAPMRDDTVDEMQKDIEVGALEIGHEKLVSGLRQLLSILEAMKLDVANHQIRHMHPLLVDDTINFQRHYNAHRIATGKIDVCKARKWFDAELEHLTTPSHQATHLQALTSALLKDVLFNESSPIPLTFYLDSDRLKCIRLDVRSTIYYSLCRKVLAELAPTRVTSSELLRAQGALHVSISAIVGISGRFTERIENIAVEIVRILLILEGRYPPLDTSLLGLVEQKLAVALSPASEAFDQIARDTCDRLLPKVTMSVEEHIRLSALDLQNALVTSAGNQLPPPPIGIGAVLVPPEPTRNYDPDDDIVRRLTHVICLHWNVWAELVYLAPVRAESEMLDEESPMSPGSSGSLSPTMPIAQAVYAPGKKWLPVGVTVTEVSTGIPTPASSPETKPEQPCPDSPSQSDAQQEQESLDAQQKQKHPT